MTREQLPYAEVLFSSVAAGLAEKSLLHPLDTLKTRLQYMVVPGRSQQLPILGDIRNIISLLGATSSPVSTSVPSLQSHVWPALPVARSLYRGLGPQLVGVVPVALVYMPSYELVKATIHGTPLAPTPFAGVVTGAISATVRVPVSVVKSRLQLGLHSSAVDAVMQASKHGQGGLYAGFRATLVLDVSFAVIQFTCLERLRLLALRLAPDLPGGARPSDPSHLGTPANLAIGFGTGVLSSTVTEPLDVVRTRLMTQRSWVGEGVFAYEGVLHGLQKAVDAEGFLALWKGLLPRLLLKGFGGTIWYASYMKARQLYRARNDSSDVARSDSDTHRA